MNKKEMLEAMAHCNFCYHRFGKCIVKNRKDCSDWDNAKYNYEKGYRKIPEGSVVLTEMQYNALLSKQSTVISIDEQLKKEFEYELKQARKETAREILKELYGQIDEKTPKWVETQVKMKAKQFGVEVEE